jgi:CRP-like cAMP-binding protein
MNCNSALENRLLRSLPSAELSHIRHKLRPIELPAGKVLYKLGDTLDYVYFPEDAVVASLAGEEDGVASETATTGREGLVGIGAISGDPQAAFRHVVQVPGSGQRVQFRDFQKLMSDFSIFRNKILAYSRAFLIQAMQSAACNGRHSVRQRYARWLLTYHDRIAGNEFYLTQERLAEMLSVSRVALNRVTNALQCGGCIKNSRGAIAVTDRHALEEICCNCYFLVRLHYDRLLPGSFTK